MIAVIGIRIVVIKELVAWKQKRSR